MPNFSYKALGRDGKEVRGVLQAESEAAAASRIRENYPILLSISQKKEKKRPDDGSLLEMEIGSRRIKTKKLAILCSQFAITLHSGMTVARAMRMLADQNEDKRIRKIMGAAAEEVAAGSTVASALEKYSDRFPLTFIETIRAGEQSGTLERSFDRLQIAGILIFFGTALGLPEPGRQMLRGVLTGAGLAVSMLALSLLFDRLTGKESLGGGDVKLFFVTGLYMRSAWEVLFFLILSCVLGIAGSVIGRREKIPFGPAIAAACFCMLLYGDIWTQWYTGLF